MVEVSIRDYEAGDLAACRRLWEELTQRHRDIYDSQTIGGGDPGRQFDEHLDKVGPALVWVAEMDGEVVGLTGLILTDGEGEIEPMIVTPKRRGCGVGRALVNHAIEAARSHAVRLVNARPVARNVAAIEFFWDAGLRTLGHIEMFLDLEPEKGRWRPGEELAGRQFDV